ncbi:MAG: rod shape-determining protein MreC [Vallitaleaceae bacterium]|nr:rod shape-determining protein MreC [Vallitaleaceae bacterium]
MARRRRFTSQKIMTGISVLFLFLMILTWETRTEITPIEKSVAYVVIPVQKGVTYFGDWLVGSVNFIKNINELEQLNIALNEEVNQLTYENKILDQSKSELERLRTLYELDQRYADYPKTGSRVISKDPGNWYHVFTIDKGESAGFKPDMVVMSGAGLLGKIIEVGPNYSKVRSIIDDKSSVSAFIVRTEDLCIVKGDLTLYNDGLLRVEYIGEDVNLIIGDEVTTSHLGEVYPPGILIGHIVEIENNPNRLTQVAYLKPVVDFKHMDEVLVIKRLWRNQ